MKSEKEIGVTESVSRVGPPHTPTRAELEDLYRPVDDPPIEEYVTCPDCGSEYAWTCSECFSIICWCDSEESEQVEPTERG